MRGWGRWVWLFRVRRGRGRRVRARVGGMARRRRGRGGWCISLAGVGLFVAVRFGGRGGECDGS